MPTKKTAFLNQFYTFSHSSKAAITLVSHLILGYILIIAALSAMFYLAYGVLHQQTMQFDNTIIQFIYQFRGPVLTTIMLGFTFIGGEIFLTLAMLCAMGYMYWKSRKNTLIFSFILIFGVILNLLLKSLFHRPRPDFLPLVHESTFSFPSGHSMNSFIFYTAMYLFIFRRIRNKSLNIVLLLVSISIVLCIGLSRIYLGAHYPSDVLAGYTAGFLWFLTVLLFDKTLQFFRLFNKFGSGHKK